MMNDEEFKELVMICIDKLKDETIFELIENDEQYQRTIEEEGKADRAYHELQLEPEQGEICDHVIACRDKQWYEYSTFTYIARLRDAYRAERLFFPQKGGGQGIDPSHEEEDMIQGEVVIFMLYQLPTKTPPSFSPKEGRKQLVDYQKK